MIETSSERNKVNIPILRQLEIDSRFIRQNTFFVAAASHRGLFHGQITLRRRVVDEFSVLVEPSPSAPVQTIDCSKKYSGSQLKLVEGGSLLVMVSSGDGGHQVLLMDDAHKLFFSNIHLQSGQRVFLRLIRPGKHIVQEKVTEAHARLKFDTLPTTCHGTRLLSKSA